MEENYKILIIIANSIDMQNYIINKYFKMIILTNSRTIDFFYEINKYITDVYANLINTKIGIKTLNLANN